MKKIDISQIDAFFAAGIYPIEFLLFYKHRLNTKNIRNSLKCLSASFWPMFGEYSQGQITNTKYIENNFYDEEEIANEFNPRENKNDLLRRFNKSVPWNTGKMFFLKVLHFKNGTVLIPKMNHLAGDGYSYFYFLTLFSELSKTSKIPFKRGLIKFLFKPNHQRTILKDYKFKDLKNRSSDVEEDLNIYYKQIPKDQIKQQRTSVKDKYNKNVSTNDLLSAMIIKDILERSEELSTDSFTFTMPIDVRRQIREYGKKYFGNCLMIHQLNFSKSEIESADINDLAIKIREAMPEINKASFLQYLNRIEEHIISKQTDNLNLYDPQKGCLVTNLSRLPTNKLDFGKGKPDFVFPLTIAKNSTAIMTDEQNYILRIVI